MTHDGKATVFAVDVGGSAIKSGFATSDGQLHELRSVPIEIAAIAGDVVGGLARFIQQAVSEAPPGLNVTVVALVVPGIVDTAAGVGRMSTMLGWREAPIRDRVQEASGVPTVLGHDVSAAAIAEGTLGAGRGHHDWVFLALGTGLGSALVLDGTPYRGSNGWGGELSHFVVQTDGPQCPCGKRGCLEVLASASAIAARYHDITSEQLSAAQVAERAAGGEAAAGKIWDEAINALVTALSATVESLNPSAIVVGGGMASSGDLLLGPLTAGIQRHVAFVQPTPVIRPGALGVYAGVHGAALLGWGSHDEERQQ